MQVSTWKATWQTVFWVGSVFFYLTVIMVTLKGLGDVAGRIRGMLSRRDIQKAKKRTKTQNPKQKAPDKSASDS